MGNYDFQENFSARRQRARAFKVNYWQRVQGTAHNANLFPLTLSLVLCLLPLYSLFLRRFGWEEKENSPFFSESRLVGFPPVRAPTSRPLFSDKTPRNSSFSATKIPGCNTTRWRARDYKIHLPPAGEN